MDKAGISIGNTLKLAAQRDVAVNVLLDCFGCKGITKTYLEVLKNAGIQVLFIGQKYRLGH